MTNTNNQNTALQVTNFDFYGDNLIALQDNAICEIYTAINSVLICQIITIIKVIYIIRCKTQQN